MVYVLDGVLPIAVPGDGDEAIEVPESTAIPPLTLSDMPPETLTNNLRNPAVERKLSPSRMRLEQRAAEFESAKFLDGEEGEPHECQEGEGEAGDAAGTLPTSITDEGAEAAAEAPPSPSKVKRFAQLPQLSDAGGLPKWNHFYTEESINQRVQLMQHPKVKQALDHLWTAANFNAEDEIIDKEEYLLMHRKIVLALEPGTHHPPTHPPARGPSPH